VRVFGRYVKENFWDRNIVQYFYREEKK
jgi:hypothetical protein